MERIKKRFLLFPILLAESFILSYIQLLRPMWNQGDSLGAYLIYFFTPIFFFLTLFAASGFLIGNIFKKNLIFILMAIAVTFVLTYLMGSEYYAIF